jgi:hypothetical protein
MEARQECLLLLEKNTGMGKTTDPFKTPNDSAWIVVSQVLSQMEQETASLDVASRYVEFCYQIQSESNMRLDKTMALYWLSEGLYAEERTETAKGAILLAYVEECSFSKSVRHDGLVYSRLRGTYSIASSILESLGKFARDFPSSYFPDEVLTSWELDNAPQLSLLYPKRQRTRS